MNSLIAIRVDASQEIGSGHLKRCLSLAKALQNCGARVVLICRPLDQTAEKILQNETFEVRWLPKIATKFVATNSIRYEAWAQIDWFSDANQVLELLQGERVDRVLVDHYAFDARWMNAISQALKCPIAVIDDLADRTLACDVLIDPNWHEDHRKKYAGLMAETKILAGPHYALLDPLYAQAPHYQFNTNVRSIGIFMGGTDPQNHSVLALRACREQAQFAGDIEVVTTSANPHLDLLRAACATDPKTTLLIDQPNLIDFFTRHDLQIGAGGSANWERCCMGAPTITMITADNQLQVIPSLDRLGAVRWVQDPADLATEIQHLVAHPNERQALSVKAQELVDGHGATRVALRLLSHTMQVRIVTPLDTKLLHTWRNHPSTRAASLNTDEIDPNTHRAWIQSTLQDPNRILLMGVVGQEAVGSIRFDLSQDATQAEVSLYLNPALHGLGLGHQLLRLGEQELARRVAKRCLVIAQVRTENAASHQLFKLGSYSQAGAIYQKQITFHENP